MVSLLIIEKSTEVKRYRNSQTQIKAMGKSGKARHTVQNKSGSAKQKKRPEKFLLRKSQEKWLGFNLNGLHSMGICRRDIRLEESQEKILRHAFNRVKIMVS